MNHEEVSELVDLLNEEMTSHGIEHSYAYLRYLDSSDDYSARLVVHPDEGDLLPPNLPDTVTTEPWGKDSKENSPYVNITPRTPMPTTDDYFFYPSWAKRRTDGPSSSPDINPAAPGLRRIPELQDLVRVSSMNHVTRDRINGVLNSLQTLSRLRKFAIAGNGYARDSEYLISELLNHLASEGHTGRHKVVRLVKSLRKAMLSDGYTFAGDC